MYFAVSAVLRDAVWVNAFLVFVSDRYNLFVFDRDLWHKQYLAGSSGLVFKQVLNSSIRFGIGDDTRIYGETSIVYKAAAAAPFHALKEISMQH